MNLGDISVGDILHGLEIVTIVVGGLRMSYSMGRTHKAIEASIDAQQKLSQQQAAELDDLKMEIRSINSVLKEVAVQDSRLNRLEQDIGDLRRGQGMSTEMWGSIIEGAVARSLSTAAQRSHAEHR